MTESSRAPFILPGYESLFGQFDLDEVVSSPATCIGLNRDLTMVLLNPAYYTFARDNGGSAIPVRFGLGTNILDAIEGTLHRFFNDLFRRAMDGSAAEHFDYECSSSDVFRVFRMIMYPVADGRALLVDHSLTVSTNHNRVEAAFDTQAYTDQNGIAHVCGHCRRVRHLILNRWDWCPDVLQYGNVTHGLCSFCLDYYHPKR